MHSENFVATPELLPLQHHIKNALSERLKSRVPGANSWWVR